MDENQDDDESEEGDDGEGELAVENQDEPVEDPVGDAVTVGFGERSGVDNIEFSE